MKYQSYLPFDCSTLANYLAWAQGIGNGLAAVGWTKTSDTGQVVWANVTNVPALCPVVEGSLAPVTAWSAGTAYAIGANPDIGAFSVVTNSGLTYACISSTQYASLNAVVQNTATGPYTPTSITVSGNSTVLNGLSGLTAGALVGYIYAGTGGSNSANNATAICVSNTTTTITLQFVGAAQSTGTFPSFSSSASNWTVGSTVTYASGATWLNNGLVGHSMTTTGFQGSGNNTTFTVTASAFNSGADAWIGGTVSGTSETSQSGQATENTAPASDPVHWVNYNFEIWQSTDSLSSTCPLYLRIVYASFNSSAETVGVAGLIPAITMTAATGTTGAGWVNGNVFSNSYETFSEFANFTFGVSFVSQQGANTFECDFCVSEPGGSLSMALWRNGPNGYYPVVLVLDRAKDGYGNDLDSFAMCLFCNYSHSVSMVGSQTIFKPGINTTQPVGDSVNYWPTVPALQTSLQINGQAPVLPIFPCPGYFANPCLGAVTMASGDAVNGALQNAFMYGQIHTFLICTVYQSVVDGGYNTNIGIRWE